MLFYLSFFLSFFYYYRANFNLSQIVFLILYFLVCSYNSIYEDAILFLNLTNVTQGFNSYKRVDKCTLINILVFTFVDISFFSIILYRHNSIFICFCRSIINFFFSQVLLEIFELSLLLYLFALIFIVSIIRLSSCKSSFAKIYNNIREYRFLVIEFLPNQTWRIGM